MIPAKRLPSLDLSLSLPFLFYAGIDAFLAVKMVPLCPVSNWSMIHSMCPSQLILNDLSIIVNPLAPLGAWGAQG